MNERRMRCMYNAYTGGYPFSPAPRFWVRGRLTDAGFGGRWQGSFVRRQKSQQGLNTFLKVFKSQIL